MVGTLQESTDHWMFPNLRPIHVSCTEEIADL